jgi:hypothetical protein
MTTTPDTSCRHCDREIPAAAKYCPGCGYSTQRRPVPVELIGVTLIMLGVLLVIVARPEPGTA